MQKENYKLNFFIPQNIRLAPWQSKPIQNIYFHIQIGMNLASHSLQKTDARFFPHIIYSVI